MRTKEESTFAAFLVPPSPYYWGGSSYSVLLLLSDDSPLQEYLTEPRLIIWLSVRELGIPLDYRQVNGCLVQLAAGLSLPLHLSSPLQSTLRWKQGSLSHHIPHSCTLASLLNNSLHFVMEVNCRKSDDPPRLWFRSHLKKAASHFIINRYGCLTQGGCERCSRPLICLPAISFEK